MKAEDKKIYKEVNSGNRENKAIKYNFSTAERRIQLKDRLTKTQIKILRSMSQEEIHYLLNDCGIARYIEHLNSSEPGDFCPTLLVKGDALQLEKFKLMIILKYMSLERQILYYYPADFDIKSPLITGEHGAEKIAENPNLIFVCIKRGSSTTEGMDGWRTKLISTTIAQRRATKLFTVVLYEELNTYPEFDNNPLYNKIVIDSRKCTPQDKSKVVQEVSSATNTASGVGGYDMYGSGSEV